LGWCMIVFHSLLCCVVDEVFMKEEADGIYYSGEKGGTRRCEAGGQRSIKYQVSHDEHIRKPSSCNKVETYLDLMIYKFQKKKNRKK